MGPIFSPLRSSNDRPSKFSRQAARWLDWEAGGGQAFASEAHVTFHVDDDAFVGRASRWVGGGPGQVLPLVEVLQLARWLLTAGR